MLVIQGWKRNAFDAEVKTRENINERAQHKQIGTPL